VEMAAAASHSSLGEVYVRVILADCLWPWSVLHSSFPCGSGVGGGCGGRVNNDAPLIF
jgi:hypothetical protein